MLSCNAVCYTMEHLLKVALPTRKPIHYVLGLTEQGVWLMFTPEKKLFLPIFSESELLDFYGGQATYQLVDSVDGEAQFPVFYAGEISHKIPFDIITPSFILLSRAEENRTLERDVHDRFPFKGSLADKYHFVHVPLVDEYAMLLRKWILERIELNVTIEPRKPQFIPTHDIDHLFRFKGCWQAFKSIVGRDLLINKSIPDAKRSYEEFLRFRQDKSQDPYVQAIYELVDQSVKHNLKSVFFFKSLLQQEYDCTYSVEDVIVKNCIDYILKNGMQVGLHGSYDSYDDVQRLGLEKQRLENVIGQPVTSCRQHYLRFSLQPDLGDFFPEKDKIQKIRREHFNTVQVWQENGVSDDYTLGFAEQPGFRCGTCHPYPLYDLNNDCPTTVMEHPLIVMDGSLFDYQKLTIDQSNVLIDKLRKRCVAVEGDFVLLWHNHLLSRNYVEKYQRIFMHQMDNEI